MSPDAGPAIAHDDQLLDVLGARLHFEQNQIRLYEALLDKYDARGGFAAGPTRAELVEIRNEELIHVRLLDTLICELGGDPAVQTPAAIREVIGIRGLAEIVKLPRTTLLDSLEALLTAELADHEQWLGLVELARELERDDLARSFATAQSTEHMHLSKLRSWISAGRAANRIEVR